MGNEANKSIYRNYVRALAHPDQIGDVVTENFVGHDLPPQLPKGIEGLRAYRRAVMAAFPDQVSEIQDLMAEGDKVSARLVLKGTHKGDFAGIKATGKTLAVEVYEIARIEGGKVAERWCLLDRAAMMQQLNG